jgi:hypothetical protein
MTISGQPCKPLESLYDELCYQRIRSDQIYHPWSGMPWFGLTVLEYLGTDAARETCLIFTSYFGISVIWWRTRHHGENDLRFGNFEELESKSLESKMIWSLSIEYQTLIVSRLRSQRSSVSIVLPLIIKESLIQSHTYAYHVGVMRWKRLITRRRSVAKVARNLWPRKLTSHHIINCKSQIYDDFCNPY